MTGSVDLEARVAMLEAQIEWAEHAIHRLSARGELQTVALGLAFKRIAQTGDLRDEDISEWKRRLEAHADELVDRAEEEGEEGARGLRVECDEAIRLMFLIVDGGS